MPIYVYRCLKCGREIEKVRPIPARDKPVLCQCGGVCRRVITAPRTIIIKGHPYVTDESRKRGGLD